MIYLALLAAGAIVAADQWLKALAAHYLAPIGTRPLIDGVLHLTYVENRGMAFSLMEGHTWLLVWVTGLILLGLLAYLLFGKDHSAFLKFSLAAIIGGGAGNLIDRIFSGYVVDYIDFRLINFAVFNFADICVCLGTVALMVYILLLEPRRQKKDRSDDL